MSDNVKNDKMYCEIIAKSISDIIRFSLNDDYRRKCSELFGVFSTAQTEKEICNRLITILENMSQDSKKRSKKSSNEKDKENTEEKSDISEGEGTDESTDTAESESEMVSANASKKSWLQISSQQYRAEVKRKKLKFFSQPLVDSPSGKDAEFSGCSASVSHSQPTSEAPSSSSLTDMMNNKAVLEDGVSFCKKKFKESFKENAQKYFKENLKYRDINF